MQINGGYSEQSFPLENQFVGRFQGVPGIVQTEDGEIELKMRGEVALYGENSGDDFGIERLRRVLVLGVPIAPIENDPFGILSLGGPLPDSPLKYDGDFVDGLHMKLHYRRLSREDPRRPRREIIGGRLSWQSINPIDYDTIQLEGVAFTTYMLEDKSLEYVFEVKFAEPVNIILRRIQPKNEAALLFSLVDHCPPPDTPCPPPGPTTTTTTGAVRNVPIKFINLSNVADVSTLCEEQVEEICAIWRKKAALDVTLSPNQEGASSVNWAVVNASVAEKADFINFDEDDDRARLAGDIPGVPRLLGSDDHIEVYIVETLSAPGGVSNGVTYYGGTWLAMCVLARPEMAADSRLLAHELCHVLGLDHLPIDPALTSPTPGSWGSIAEVNLPSFPSANTVYNRRVLTGLSWAADNPYYYAGFSDAYCPDRVDHFIRDYPDDEGTEPSDASIPSYNKSNLWNRRAIGAGATNSDGSPDHQDPYCGATNYMYVKLEYVKPADAPSEPGPRNGNATVEIYLGEPGASTSLQPIASPNQISFPPGSSYVDTRYLVWNSPPGLPPHCCAFAIAYSDVVEDGVTYGEPRPFLAGTDPTWAEVHSIRNLSNDIAQRNLNFLDCAKDDTTDDLDGDAEAGEAERVTFPWVQAANIVAKEETAFTLQVDPHPDLPPLVLELNGEIVGPLDGRIELPPLAHNKHVVIRLHTTVPSRGRLGQTFPVNMTFLHDGEPFGGYEHVLRIATLEQTTPQVLSALFAALRDLSIAADAVEAWELAQKVQQLVWKGVILPDNWSLIEKLYGHKRGDLLVELRALADDFTALGRSLSERKWGTAVQRHVVALGKLMNQRAKSPAQFLERLRELADRIQEPAGYVVRRTRRAHRRVRFVLKRIKVLDDKETWFPSPGELIFNVAIIPDGNLDKAVCRRVPTEGYISLRDGESKNFDFVLFDGYVEDGTILDVSMGGAEMDNLLFFTKKNPLTRYRRRFIDDTLSWAGAYTPEDEPGDPEALYDWQLWYEVEVM